MKGQWIGQYSGSNQGQIVVELDELPDCYRGWAYLFDAQEGYPHSSAFIKTTNKECEQEFEVSVGPINAAIVGPSAWDEAKSNFPDFQFPVSAKVKLKKIDSSLKVDWVTNIGTSGEALIPRSNADKKSELEVSKIDTWKKFKDYVFDLPQRKFIFRGQRDCDNWRLRTLFHRSGRADLRRLIFSDIDEIYRATVNITSHKFDMKDADERGAFYALVQHHGFPTPLLDWTYSPFVAAFFAYSDLPKESSIDNGRCRLFVFDAEQWTSDFPQLVNVYGVQPHFSLLRPLALGNPRMVQQQALVTLTNVDDLESYIRNIEQRRDKLYLQAIDLPTASRAEVMADLDLMGITAASLFPGIDGVCKYQRERLF